MSRAWTADEHRLLKRFYGAEGVTVQDSADCLERSFCAGRSRILVLGLKIDKRQPWTDAAKQRVRELFASGASNQQIAEALGRTRLAVYQACTKLGLKRKRRWTDSEQQMLRSFIADRHAEQWSDRVISNAWNEDHADPRVSREWVTEGRRLKCGRAANGNCERRRRRVAAKTREQIEKAGVHSLAEVRTKAFADFAARQGWPGVKRPRCVQILNLLYEQGPQTRMEIAATLGLSWNPCKHKPQGFGLRGNGPGGTYTSELLRLGLIVQLGRKVQTDESRYAKSQVYAIAPGVVRGPISSRSQAS